MSSSATLETDYLVVGAGALAMAFVDTLIDHSDADIIMVERRHRPGGHWSDAYPFVQLHQPSRYYGVDSTPLGHDRLGAEGSEPDFYERAGGAEICAYYDEIMRHRFLTSGSVRFYPMCEYLGEHRFRSRVTGRVTEVAVRKSVVDATYMTSRVPATDPPPFAVADGARCTPVGGLTALEDAPDGYVVIGGGKTALDAMCWLLDRGTEPNDITWIRPRDSWVLDRAFFQPDRTSTFAGVVLQLEAMVASASVAEVYERLEAVGLMLRTDTTVTPTMMKGATISRAELEQLRRLENVVRLGHVERIEPDEIVLEHGTVPTTPHRLHVHCAAPGLSDRAPRPIFGTDTITLQVVTRMSLTLSGALLGVLESSGRGTDEKNRLCPPTAWPHTPFDYLRAILAGISTEMRWRDAPELHSFVDRSRLNLTSGVRANPDRAGVAELQKRFSAALLPALDALRVFAAQATQRERARIFTDA